MYVGISIFTLIFCVTTYAYNMNVNITFSRISIDSYVVFLDPLLGSPLYPVPFPSLVVPARMRIKT